MFSNNCPPFTPIYARVPADSDLQHRPNLTITTWPGSENEAKSAERRKEREDRERKLLAKAKRKEWAKGLARYVTEDKYSDLVIKCGDHFYNAHKVVVCSRSEFFEKACGGGFKEATENVIELHEDDPENVDRMLLFLYTGDYRIHEVQDPETATTEAKRKILRSQFSKYFPKDGGSSSIENSPSKDIGLYSGKEETPSCNIVIHAQVYALADKYQIPSLWDLSEKKFKDALETTRWNWIDFFMVADLLWAIPGQHQKIKQVSLAILVRYVKLATGVAEFKQMTQTNPEFAWDLVEAFGAAKDGEEKKSKDAMRWADECKISGAQLEEGSPNIVEFMAAMNS